VGSHNICSKTDRALVAYLISEQAGTADDVYPAKRPSDKGLPDTICFSSRARLETPHSGVYVVTAMVQVRTDPTIDTDQTAEDKKQTSEDRVAATFDAFWAEVDSASDKLAEAITTAARASTATGDEDLADFTVQACTVVSQEAGFDPKGNAWTDTIELEMVVCPSNVS
jgi:hypothetical protein